MVTSNSDWPVFLANLTYALDKGGRTIRSGTLSKILGAGVRLAWLCATRQMIPAFQGFLFGGGEEFIRLAYSWETPERNYEGAKQIAQAIKNAR